jgi:23S rRNA (guanosine2251-2'-O)-methyltransferase
MAKTDMVYGLHTVQALFERHPERILELQVLQGRADERLSAIIAMAYQHGISMQHRDRHQLDQLVEGGNHQGVVARVRESVPGGDNELWALLDELSEPPFLLILDNITDPHNLGACLRSADGAGVHAVIAPRDKAAGLTPVARKVASGAAEVLPFFQVTNLARVLKELRERGVWLVGTDLDATAKPIYACDLTGPLAIVMGAEGTGMRRLTRENCDGLAYIPMAGSVDSLNVAVATGVTLFEARRQRLAAKK